MSVGEKKDFNGLQLILREFKGDTNNPAVVVELAETGEKSPLITREKKLMHVDGYMTSMRYPPENRNFFNYRKGDLVPFGGEDYKIVAIRADEVVLSAQSNQKKKKKKFKPSP